MENKSDDENIFSLLCGDLRCFKTDNGIKMAHKKRNGILGWRNKKANHGVKPNCGKEKSRFERAFRRKRKLPA